MMLCANSDQRCCSTIQPIRSPERARSIKGKVNIFNLAKNAGTSVDQIERFYARNLPLSREMAINFQSFGDI
jgi:hypothetical protein